MNMRGFLFICSLLLTSQIFAVDYFWVGNGGNWSDLSHWASSSGGAGVAFGTQPTTSDNVHFDVNSFSIGGQTVTVDINGFCDDLDFTGVSNNPTFDGGAAIDIEVGRSIVFVAGFTHSYTGEYEFTSGAAETITSAGQSFNNNIEFNGTAGSWTLTDVFTINGEIGIQRGTLDFSGFDVTATSIDANRGTQMREIDFGGSEVDITGTGTVLDLQGNTTSLTVTTAGSTITFTNTGDVTVEAGSATKTLPNLTFNSTNDVRVNTGGVEDNTNRITFGDIVAVGDGVDIRFDGDYDDNNVKTFGSITYGNNCR